MRPPPKRMPGMLYGRVWLESKPGVGVIEAVDGGAAAVDFKTAVEGAAVAQVVVVVAVEELHANGRFSGEIAQRAFQHVGEIKVQVVVAGLGFKNEGIGEVIGQARHLAHVYGRNAGGEGVLSSLCHINFLVETAHLC